MTTDSASPSGVVLGPAGAVAHGTPTLESWVDLLVADDEWVRREFEDIVAAGWGGAVPPSPAPIQGSHRPRRPGYDDRPSPLRLARDGVSNDNALGRQRGPPLRVPSTTSVRAATSTRIWRRHSNIDAATRQKPYPTNKPPTRVLPRQGACSLRGSTSVASRHSPTATP